MALVRSSGLFTVYINDVAKNTSVLVANPVLATDMLSIGNFDSTPAGFAGVVDETRVFTFTAGAFNPATDLGGAAVPESSTLVLLGTGAIGLLGHVLVRRRAA